MRTKPNIYRTVIRLKMANGQSLSQGFIFFWHGSYAKLIELTFDTKIRHFGDVLPSQAFTLLTACYSRN